MKTSKFKMTEIGEIPADWEVKRLGDIGLFSKGAGISRAQANSGKIPAVRYGELYTTHHNYIKRFESFISDEVAKESTQLTYGDIVFACSGETKEEIGKCAAFLGSEVAYAGGDLIILSPRNGYDSKFLAFELNAPFCALQKASAGQGDAVVHIRRESLENLIVVIPSLAEQKAIAEALSDVDALIAAQEELIEKKRAIKQGAMQELLTGKKRLPGFGGKSSRTLRDKKSPTENAEIAEFKQTELGEIPVDWEVKRLGDCGFCFNGITGKSGNDFGHGKSRYITFLNVLTNIVIDSSIFELVNICSNEKQNEVRQGDIFFNTSSETPEEVGLCAVLEEDVKSVYLNSFCFGFRITDNDVSGKFLAYWFRSAAGRTLMTTLAQGSTRYNLSKESFRGAYVCIPPSLAEQKAIAEVLSDMDAEISELEAQKAKFESIKQGMMQELLTGKTRLV